MLRIQGGRRWMKGNIIPDWRWSWSGPQWMHLQWQVLLVETLEVGWGSSGSWHPAQQYNWWNEEHWTNKLADWTSFNFDRLFQGNYMPFMSWEQIQVIQHMYHSEMHFLHYIAKKAPDQCNLVENKTPKSAMNMYCYGKAPIMTFMVTFCCMWILELTSLIITVHQLGVTGY